VVLIVRPRLVVLARCHRRRGIDRLDDGVRPRLDLGVVVGVRNRAEVRHEDPG
jgi:hypothetical protein